MDWRARQREKQAVLSVLVGILGLLVVDTIAWASTRVGNAELQMW